MGAKDTDLSSKEFEEWIRRHELAAGIRPDSKRTRRANLVKRLKEAARYYDRRVIENTPEPRLPDDPEGYSDARLLFDYEATVREFLLAEAYNMRDLLEEAARELDQTIS